MNDEFGRHTVGEAERAAVDLLLNDPEILRYLIQLVMIDLRGKGNPQIVGDYIKERLSKK